ncbi:hypothetical protein HOR75_gp58 [Shewanella phage SppYZU05]|uniref:Uncharacterized protein n=1 Tax=Shewanella phage SppYZU05 TaxID=1970795 RepID=A0A1W6JTH4_9CAUD|nr:hypothetical protein HOR75_gp58 [Shewanella phage SppYZU05]ARM70584.1 hypothetical protein SppYZU05_58 [Shewanella phage SppYZU05]
MAKMLLRAASGVFLTLCLLLVLYIIGLCLTVVIGHNTLDAINDPVLASIWSAGLCFMVAYVLSEMF